MYCKPKYLLTLSYMLVATGMAFGSEDLLIEDFEADSFRNWIIAGASFGDSPATGALPNQLVVTGFQGKRLANSFHQGDTSVGTVTSPEFTIKRSHIAFLIGGGPHSDSLGIRLLIDGKTVRSATGGESEDLICENWDVTPFMERTAQIQIEDNATRGWGHILVDHIIQTDHPPDRFQLEARLAEYRTSAGYMNEPLRPQFHFSPEVHWMNDPNGLVHHNGEFHLFQQYNPAGNDWGHMSWGHAVSNDLVHWQHLPLAIPEEPGVMAFSGSCVVDYHNTSGFAGGQKPPMVAIYTGHSRGKQCQNLAFSTDNGRSWTKYSGNPVLDIGEADFRDPKVFWHEPTSRWVMVVSLAVEKMLVFYESKDLKSWREISRFGPAGVLNKPNWECPDLFELPIDGESDRKLWVLQVSIGDGSIAGGSGGEYFAGHFDGTRFTAIQQHQWVDYGRDFYAPISWENVPKSDGRRIWIGWLNNWETSLVPTSPWRSCMSIPRSLSLRKVAFNNEEPATYVLVQKPVAELEKLRTSSRSLDVENVSWPPQAVTQAGELKDLTFELEATLTPGDSRSLGFRIRTGDDEFTEVGYDRNFSAVYLDRHKSGNVNFHKAFSGRHLAPARLVNGQVTLRLFVDRSTVEVFINDGEAMISDLIFPTGQQRTIEVFKGHDSGNVSVRLHALKSVWR